MVLEVADGKRGDAPATVTFLSGDVGVVYVAEVDRKGRQTRLLQAVCSPIRNPLPRAIRYAMAFLAYGLATPLGQLARRADVPEPPFWWRNIEGPWFDNMLATLEITGRHLRLRWEKGVVKRGDDDHPTLEIVSDIDIEPVS
jgi:hypothetical protein